MTNHGVLLVGDAASVHTRRLATALAERGLRVDLAGFEGDSLGSIPVHRLGDQALTAHSRYPRAIPKLARLMRRMRPRIVHAHYVSSYGVMASAALIAAFPLRARPRFLQSAWGYDLLVTAKTSRVRRSTIGFALRTADLITSDSVDLDAAAAELAPRVPRMRFAWGPPRSLFEREAGLEPLIVVARALVAHTRVDLVVEAFKLASRRWPEEFDSWRLAVVGDGPEHGQIAAMAAGESSISVLGRLALSELRDLLARARIYANVPATDATSAILLDSLALGLIPVVNDLPAYREWIDRSIGEVVSLDPSVDELANALRRAVHRTADVEAIRAKVRSTMWETEVDDLVVAYQLPPDAVDDLRLDPGPRQG